MSPSWKFFFLVMILLTISNLNASEELMEKAEKLLATYPEYQPPVQSAIGGAEQTAAESWEEYYEERANAAAAEGIRETGDITVKVMPTYFCWPGEELILWGNVSWENYSGNGNYYWDFGDGSQSDVITISNQRYLNTTHTYSVMSNYLATLVVEDDLGQTASETVRIVIMDIDNAEENKAIEDGLRYLYLQQYADGHWLGNYSFSPAPEVAATSLAILSYEENGHLPWLSLDDDIYKEVVQRGFAWLWNEIERTTLSVQAAGNPDMNGDSYGYHFSGDRSTYSDPMALMAIITSGSPYHTVENGPDWVVGQTYEYVAQNIIDQLLWSQTESGSYRGGWRYHINSANYGSSDTSTTQWPVMGLIAGENWDLDIPGWVYDELGYWVDYVQNDVNGSFGYDNPNSGGNLARIGSGLTSIYSMGGSGAGSVSQALSWLANNYTLNDGYSGIYGLYSLYKGLWFYDMLQTPIGGHNWYEEFTNYLINTQTAEGSWAGNWGGHQLNTSFGILVLTPRVIVPNEMLAVDIRNVLTGNFPNITLLIDVFSAGQSLAGLSGEDFLVTEDGITQEIEFDYEFDQYRVTYMTTMPYPTDNTRIVIAEVTIEEGEENITDYDDITYVYQPRPVIERTAATINLSNMPQQPGQSILLEVAVFDDNPPFINEVWLHYRDTGSGEDYQAVEMNNTEGMMWQGSTGSDVEFPGIDYYFTGSDGAIEISDPINSPVANPYHIPVDNFLPVIEHDAVLFSEANQAVSISAIVADESDSLESVNLHYRSADDFLWSYQSMALAGDIWTADIPAEQMGESGVYYLISATDNYGLTAYFGSYDDPLRIVNAARGNLRGVVTESLSGEPVMEATIELLQNGELCTIENSNFNGSFVIYDVEPGYYTVRAGRTGYVNENSGQLEVTAGTELIFNFELSLNDNIDLCVSTLSIMPISGEEQPLLITALLRNLGVLDAPASEVVVSAVDYALPQQPVYEVFNGMIPALASGESYTLQIPFSIVSSYMNVIAEIDPDNLIAETDESNNVLSREIEFNAPIVEGLTALYDGNPDPEVMGRYMCLTGVQIPGSERIYNRITARVSDAEGLNNIERVEFNINGTVMIDDEPSDGFYVDFDMGQLPVGNNLLTVTAFDLCGLQSEMMYQTIEVFSAPAWLENMALDIAMGDAAGFEDGCFYYELMLNSTEGGGDIFDFGYLIAEEVEFVGNGEVNLSGGLQARLTVPLASGELPELSGGFVLYQETMESGEEIWEIPFELVLDADYNLAEVSFSSSGSAELYPIAREFTVSAGSSGLEAVLALGMELNCQLETSAAAGANLQNFSFGADMTTGSNTLRGIEVETLKGLGSGKAMITPVMELLFDLDYTSASGCEATAGGGFEVSYDLQHNLFWELYENNLISSGYGSWEFADNLMGDREEILVVPQSLPYPVFRSDSEGNFALIWISDKDESMSAVNPEVEFRYKAAEGDWLAIESITDNELFESTPAVSFMGDGRLAAVWTQNQVSQTEAAEMTDVTLEEILSWQDIYYKEFDPESGWGAAAAIISDEPGSEAADGRPAIDFSEEGQGLVLWTRSENNAQPLTPGALEIYYSVYNAGSWSTPAGLTDDLANDYQPVVCYSNGNQAVAVWQHDIDGSLLTADDNELQYSIWDGSVWSAVQNLTVNSNLEHSPVLAATGGGDIMAVWVETESFADKTVEYHLMSSIWLAATSGWGSAEEIYSSPYLIEEPVLNFDSRDIACLLFRGYDGFDGEIYFCSKELNIAGSSWTEPVQQTEDEITNWFIAGAIDNNNNLYYVDYPYDFADTTAVVRGRGQGSFADGLNLTSHGIRDDGSLRNGLNYGLVSVAPDLEISGEDIAISNETGFYENEPVTILFTVANQGNVSCSNAQVQLFYGYPGSGILIAEDLIETLAPGETAVFEIGWTLAGGAGMVTVLLDSINSIEEISEENNQASAAVDVLADLSIISLELSNMNPLLGEAISLLGVAINPGGTSAEDISIGFYDNDQLIDTAIIDSLAVGEADTVSVQYTASGGHRELQVIINPDSLILETDYTNNWYDQELLVYPDLQISNEDITFSFNGQVEIAGLLSNEGGMGAANISFQYWHNHPASEEGVKLAEIIVDSLAAFSSTYVTTTWDAPYGLSVIYAKVDSAKAIVERIETNNMAFAELLNNQLIDLAADSLNFDISEEERTEMIVEQWGSIDITLDVNNLSEISVADIMVRFYDGNPFAGGVEIAGNAASVMEAGEILPFTVNWQIENTPLGVHEIYAVIDPDNQIPETNEENNILFETVEIVIDNLLPEITIIPENLTVILESGDSFEETFSVQNYGESILVMPLYQRLQMRLT